MSKRLLILWTLFVVLGTLAPFDFSGTSPAAPLKLLGDDSHLRDPMHVALNVILFMPLGALLNHEGERRAMKIRSIVLLTCAIGLFTSLAVEYLQRYLPSRDSSLLDVLANSIGGAMGVVSGPYLETGLNEIRARMSSAILAFTLMAFMTVALLVSGRLQARTSLSNWSGDYPLLIANESTADRPWRGRVFDLTITDAATPLAKVRRFAAGESIVLSGLPIASFAFTGEPPYRDATGNLPDIKSTDTAAEVSGHPWLRTAGPAASLAYRLRKTNKFTLRIRCATYDTSQRGPARIVSNSVSPYFRNFTLGQQDTDMIFRLRTPQTGENGVRPETTVRDVFAKSNHLRDILLTYDGANVIGGIAGTDHVFRTELGPAVPIAAFLAAFTSERVWADRLQFSKMIYFGALFIPAGLLIGLFESTCRRQLLLGGAYVVLASASLEAVLVLVSGRSFLWTDVAVVGAVGCLVLVVNVAMLSPADSKKSRERRSWAVAESLF